MPPVKSFNALLLTIHAMIDADIAEVEAIEAQQHSVPWSAASFADALNQGWHCRVLKDTCDQVLGYCISMTAGDDEELLTLTVRPDSTGQGLGKQLMQELLHQARQRGASNLFLEVRESNQIAIHLYEQMGFKMTGMRKNYYPVPANPVLKSLAGRENALVMCRALAERL